MFLEKTLKFSTLRKQKEKNCSTYNNAGNKQIEIEELHAGDIGATTKLLYTQTGDTLCDKSYPVVFNKIRFPKPNIFSEFYLQIKMMMKKLSTALQRVMERRPYICCN